MAREPRSNRSSRFALAIRALAVLRGLAGTLRALVVDVRTLAVGLLALVAVPAPVAAHGGATGAHGHTLAVAAFGSGIALVAASLAADRLDFLERSTADVGLVGGGLGIVLSLGLLWF